jgi:endothelin-converting enzyme/putative endopeptidase
MLMTSRGRTAAGCAALLWVHCAAAQAPAAPLTVLPYTPALDPAAMQRDVDPCVDFYTYSCGGWQANNPIPPDRPSWDVYSKLATQNLQYLWGLLQTAAEDRADRDPAERLSGDLFAACMNEPTIEARGLAPLQDDLDAIAGLDARRRLPELFARLHAAADDDGLLFAFSSQQDPSDSNSEIATLFSGGLGLPDRDYYFKPDAKSVEIRARYRAHVAKMLGLLGDAEESPASAASEAEAIVRLETALARATLTRVAKRDPNKVNHRISARELQRLAPHFDWPEYFKARAEGDARIAPGYALVNATEPAFFRAAGRLLDATPLEDIKIYLRWHVLHERAHLLPHRIADEDFDFYQHYLRGIEQQPPRWKTCVHAVDGNLGEALGKLFVARTFAAVTKQRAQDMLKGIQAAMQQRIAALDWMTPATKAKALEKLAAMRAKIGYPEHWRDYAGLAIARDDYFGDVVRADRFENSRELAKIGKPVDRDEWGMTPPTINAYYDPQMNDINFPAGVLQPPLFDTRIDAAPSWGDTGSTMGHELTHGFDDEGRQFDAEGNLHDWWAPGDAKEFSRRAQCVVDQFSGYTAIDDIKVNGELTLGENLADLGGTILAYVGWKAATSQLTLESADGLTPDQRYFVGMAQWACGSERPEIMRLHAATDPHAPLADRVNGVVVNMPEFARAFACKAGQPMVKKPEAICRVW